jgi:ankyrin repeat protein
MYPLHWACGGGASLEVIKYLVEEADGDKGKELLGKLDKYGNYPLHHACEKGASLDVIKYLVEEVDDDKGKELLGKADNIDRYLLHRACQAGASLDVIKYLIQKNPGPLQYKDKSGRTALDYIYMDNNALKELLGKVGEDGRYPLRLALEFGASLDAINYLVVEAKADNRGRNPLHWALEYGATFDVIKYLGDGDKGKDLLGKMDNGGMYPLHLACRGASIDVMKYLIQKNPGPLQYKDNDGLTALDHMDNNTLREIFRRTYQIGSIADKSSYATRMVTLPSISPLIEYSGCEHAEHSFGIVRSS